MVNLTETQRKAMDFIWEHIHSTGAPPTLREMTGFFGWKAVGSAQDVVAALRKKGMLAASAQGKSRQLVPSEQFCDLKESDPLQGNPNQSRVQQNRRSAAAAIQEQFLTVPLLGMVQAGNPTEAIEAAGEFFPFLKKGLKTNQESSYFALRVEGYSMMNAGFLPGDVVLVESTKQAKNGDIVVAALQGYEVTVKRFALKGSILYKRALESAKQTPEIDKTPPSLLIPENSDFEPIPFGYNESDKLIGLVRALYRQDVN